jgi:hypothetical protein
MRESEAPVWLEIRPRLVVLYSTCGLPTTGRGSVEGAKRFFKQSFFIM